MPFCSAFVAGLHSLHIHNATVEFSNACQPIWTTPTCSTVRLSNIKVIVSSGQLRQNKLFVAHGRNSTLTMEDCVLETTFDSPSLFSLVAEEGGQVRGAQGLLTSCFGLPCDER
jgi:hypothetical protein